MKIITTLSFLYFRGNSLGISGGTVFKLNFSVDCRLALDHHHVPKYDGYVLAYVPFFRVTYEFGKEVE